MMAMLLYVISSMYYVQIAEGWSGRQYQATMNILETVILTD